MDCFSCALCRDKVDDAKGKAKGKGKGKGKKKLLESTSTSADPTHDSKSGSGDKDDDDDDDERTESGHLVDVTLRVPEGSLVAVIGEVGAGKTSLLEGLLLGHMKVTAGSVSVCADAMAYVDRCCCC